MATKYTAEELAAAELKRQGLSPSDILDIDEYVKNVEDDNQKLRAVATGRVVSEYPAHAWTKFTHPGEREEISIGTKGDTMQGVIDEFMAGVEYARSKGLVIVGVNTIKLVQQAAQGQLQMSVSQSPAGDVPDVPSGPSGVPLTQEEMTGKPAQGQAYVVGEEPYVKGQVFQFTCLRLKITQEASGKARVEFFTNHKKQPVDDYVFLTAIDTPANLVKKFAAVGPWTEAHFQAPYDKVLQSPFNVDWTYSEKTNTKGNHYRNLVGLEPIV